MRPVSHATDKTVPERINVAIFDMAGVVRVVADQVLPKPALPNAALVARLAHPAQMLASGDRAREARFDQPPSQREIGIAGWKRSHSVDVVGHDCIDMERITLLRAACSFAQLLDLVLRSSKLAVKNQQPPGTKARR